MPDISEFEKQITGEFYPVPFTEIKKALGSHLMLTTVKAGEFLLKEGKKMSQVYLLLKGAVRQYSISKKGEEINFLFYFENDFVMDHSSFINEEPSRYNLITLEDCTLLSIDRNGLKALKGIHPAWEILHRSINERAIVRLYKRNDLILSNSPEERYTMLVAIHPQIIQRVSLARIASFIGVTVPSLSRIRKRIVSRPVRN